MKQTSFPSAECAGKKRETRRERFVLEMTAVVRLSSARGADPPALGLGAIAPIAELLRWHAQLVVSDNPYALVSNVCRY
jgi:hypothetical protein